MSTAVERRVPWILWPFYMIWRLATFVPEAAGRIVCAVLGVVVLAVGVSLSLTLIGAPLGVPLVALGGLMLLRALF